MSLSNKKLAITLSATAILLAGTTTLLILTSPKTPNPANHNQTNNPNSPHATISNPTSPVSDESALAIKSLTETYNSPNISIWNFDTQTITQLKNKDLQSKINQDIQSSYTEIINEKQKLDAAHSDFSHYDGGYANISPGDTFSYFIYVERPFSYEIKKVNGWDAPPISVPHKVIAKNYRLDTGAEIKFDDLFVAGTDLMPILTKAAHEAIHCRTNYCGGGGLSWSPEITDIEEEVLKIIQTFRNTENPTFHFDNTDISLWIDDYQLSIRMEDWYDKIAIFKRFKSTENLYETDQTAPKFVFQTSEANYKNEFISDNLFAHINLSVADNTPEAIITQQNNLLNSVINQAITATKNQSNFYILNFRISSGESYLNDGTYFTSIQVTCGWDGTKYDYCAKLSKLPLNQPSKTSALETIATAARHRANWGDALSIPNTTDNLNFWSDFEGYTTDTTPGDGAKFSEITHHYDKSGNPIQK